LTEGRWFVACSFKVFTVDVACRSGNNENSDINKHISVRRRVVTSLNSETILDVDRLLSGSFPLSVASRLLQYSELLFYIVLLTVFIIKLGPILSWQINFCRHEGSVHSCSVIVMLRNYGHPPLQ